MRQQLTGRAGSQGPTGQREATPEHQSVIPLAFIPLHFLFD